MTIKYRNPDRNAAHEAMSIAAELLPDKLLREIANPTDYTDLLGTMTQSLGNLFPEIKETGVLQQIVLGAVTRELEKRKEATIDAGE